MAEVDSVPETSSLGFEAQDGLFPKYYSELRNLSGADNAWLPLQFPFPGTLVEVRQFGPLRFVKSTQDGYELEEFLTPWQRVRLVANPNDVRRLRVPEQTRVFVETNEQWKSGRVIASDGDFRSFTYVVQFPNEEIGTFSEQSIFVRSWRRHQDPTATLAMGAMETQFWHEHRLRFGSAVAKQNGACRGLVGIISAKVELIPHQVDVARRILEDHVQRYLLADEVGMGKTIEAGFVIRQFLLSEHIGDVLVMAPAPLLPQWRQELLEKFGIDEFPRRVRVVESNEYSIPKGTLPHLLVVDEAHHLVTSSVPGWLDDIARRVPRVLLLSATPSLRDPSVLLRLLRVIDPQSYLDVSPDDFSNRLSLQDDIGSFVRGLRADASPAILRQRVRRIPGLFPADNEALSLGERVSTALAGTSAETLEAAIRSLRAHISDLYRTHQRLVRSRRRDCPDWVFLRRGPEPDSENNVDWSHVKRFPVAGQWITECFDLLEDWRVEAAALHPPGDVYRNEAREVYCRLFEAFQSGRMPFSEQIRATSSVLMTDESKSQFFQALTPDDDDQPSRCWQIAASIRTLLQAHSGIKRRPKIVVFGSSRNDIVECASVLAEVLGTRAVLDLVTNGLGTDIAALFRDDDTVRVLLCDPIHEEGLNLHFSDVLVHLDLPLSPQRIEQRVGRLDRFGRKQDAVSQVVFLPALSDEANPWTAWLDALGFALHTFNEPIADLQFVLERVRLIATDALFEQGASGLRATFDELRSILHAERDALDNQYALDQVLQEQDEARDFFEQLDDADSDDREVDDAVHGWLNTCLRLNAVRDGSLTTTYTWSKITLLPKWPWLVHFKGALDVAQAMSRRAALTSKAIRKTQLLRVGAPLMIATEAEYQWDDRGTAFATLRVVPHARLEDQCFFRLCFYISGKLPELISSVEATALRARLDGLFPPQYRVITVDSELKPVVEPEILKILGVPYRSWDSAGNDYNLGSRPDELYARIDALRFEELCGRVRQYSETMLRSDADFLSALAGALERGRAYFGSRIRRLAQYCATKTNDRDRKDAAREIELYEATLAALADPQISLDGIGAMILTTRAPGAHR